MSTMEKELIEIEGELLEETKRNLNRSILIMSNTPETRKRLYDIQYEEDCKIADLEMDSYIDTHRLKMKHKVELKRFGLFIPNSIKNVYRKEIEIFGLRFSLMFIDEKLEQINYIKSKGFKKWLKQAIKNKFGWIIPAGEGRDRIIINLSGKRRSMERQILEEKLVKMEAQPFYSRFSKIQQLEKKIVLIEKSL